MAGAGTTLLSSLAGQALAVPDAASTWTGYSLAELGEVDVQLCLKVLWSFTHFALPDGAARDGVGQLGGWLDLLAAVIA